MSDTTAVGDTEGEQLPELVESESLGADAPAEDTPLKMRVVLPFLVPLFAILIVAVLVLNISRIFLAGDKDAALVMGIVITLAILIGASVLAATPRMTTASLAVTLGAVFVVLSLAGIISLGPSLDSGEGATTSVYTTKPANSTVTVEALATIKFNATQYNGTGPVVQFDYTGATGHTLAIQGKDGFLLTTDAGGKKTGRIELTPGDYTIYCTVPGHEAQGMKATLTVAK